MAHAEAELTGGLGRTRDCWARIYQRADCNGERRCWRWSGAHPFRTSTAPSGGNGRSPRDPAGDHGSPIVPAHGGGLRPASCPTSPRRCRMGRPRRSRTTRAPLCGLPDRPVAGTLEDAAYDARWLTQRGPSPLRPDPGSVAEAAALLTLSRRPVVVAGRIRHLAPKLLSRFLSETDALLVAQSDARALLPAAASAAVPAAKGHALARGGPRRDTRLPA
jgi:hypothetical protein